MRLFHPGLRELLKINQYLTHHQIAFLTIETKLPKLFSKWTQSLPSKGLGLHLRREYRHLMMGLDALKQKEMDTIYCLEIYNQHLFFLLPLLALSNKTIFFGLHGNQVLAQEHFIKAWGLSLLRNYLRLFPASKVVCLELDDSFIAEKFRLPLESQIIIPHPIVSEYTPRLQVGERLSNHRKVKIGIVGIIRQDKPMGKILEIIKNYVQKHDGCEIVIGTPRSKANQFQHDKQIKLLDTTKDQDYVRALQTIDILVTNYDRERYLYRASGVISDAGACGCYIIAPDFPLIKNQINHPLPIGLTYSKLDQIETLLDQAINYVKENGQDNHWLWRKGREAKAIAKIFEQKGWQING